MAPNYTLGVWKAPAASASILHPTHSPSLAVVHVLGPTSTLTPLPGVPNSSQPVGTISGRCQESKMMNYEYPGDVDRIPIVEENILFLCVCVGEGGPSGQSNKQKDSGGLCSG